MSVTPIDLSADANFYDVSELLTAIFNPTVPLVTVTVPYLTQEEKDNGLGGKMYLIENSSPTNTLVVNVDINLVKTLTPGLRAKFIVRSDDTVKLYNY